MASIRRRAIGAAAPLLAVALSCAGSAVEPEERPRGRVAGVVVEAGPETPVTGATVRMEPGEFVALTDAAGRFAFGDLQVPGDYTVTATSPAHATVTTSVALSEADPEPEIRLPLPLRPVEEPDDEAPGVRAVVVSGAFGPGETMTWRIDVAAPAGNERAIVLRDTLDPAFGAVLGAESIELDREAFPDAEVELHEDGRSFTVRLGPASTDGAFERVLEMTVPSPEEAGTVCNVVVLFAGDDRVDDDVSCITRTV